MIGKKLHKMASEFYKKFYQKENERLVDNYRKPYNNYPFPSIFIEVLTLLNKLKTGTLLDQIELAITFLKPLQKKLLQN